MHVRPDGVERTHCCPHPFSEWLELLILEPKVSLCGQCRQTVDKGVQDVLHVREVELYRFPLGDLLLQRDGEPFTRSLYVAFLCNIRCSSLCLLDYIIPEAVQERFFLFSQSAVVFHHAEV